MSGVTQTQTGASVASDPTEGIGVAVPLQCLPSVGATLSFLPSGKRILAYRDLVTGAVELAVER